MTRKLSELAVRLNHRHGEKGKYPPILLMTDEKRLPDPTALIPKLPKDSALIIRGFTRNTKKQLFSNVKKLCQAHKIRILIADDIQLASRLGCDGIHLSEKSLKKTASCGKFVRPKPDFFVTSACHRYSTLIAAQKAGIDGVLLSPVFPTKSHPQAETLGVARLMPLILQRKSLAIYPLGGISRKTAQRLIHSPINGFAGISGLV